MLTGPLSTFLASTANTDTSGELGETSVSLASGGDPASQSFLDGSGLYNEELPLDVPASQPVTDAHL